MTVGEGDLLRYAGLYWQSGTDDYRKVSVKDGVLQVGFGESPATLKAVEPSRFAGRTSDLALRANLDDRIRVEDRSGTRTTGRLTRLTADEITVRTGDGEKRFTREDVRQVAVHRSPIRMAVLIGAGVGAATGAVAACRGPDREECADATVMSGALGAGLGLAAGALMHTTAIVHTGADSRVYVWPVISRDAVGIRVGRQW